MKNNEIIITSTSSKAAATSKKLLKMKMLFVNIYKMEAELQT
jgi:hypothetical protein